MPDFDLLVRATTATHEVRKEAEAGRWRKGDVVDVFPAGQLDPKSQPECFRVVRISGYRGTREQCRDEYVPQLDENSTSRSAVKIDDQKLDFIDRTKFADKSLVILSDRSAAIVRKAS